VSRRNYPDVPRLCSLFRQGALSFFSCITLRSLTGTEGSGHLSHQEIWSHVANSKRPFFWFIAPVKAPLHARRVSLSIRLSGRAAMLT
jgi:hypothetical protein